MQNYTISVTEKKLIELSKFADWQLKEMGFVPATITASIQQMENNIYDEGWRAGYHDIQPVCPYSDKSKEAYNWWAGYWEGCRNC